MACTHSLTPVDTKKNIDISFFKEMTIKMEREGEEEEGTDDHNCEAERWAREDRSAKTHIGPK
jgi:hypothetical protein